MAAAPAPIPHPDTAPAAPHPTGDVGGSPATPGIDEVAPHLSRTPDRPSVASSRRRRTQPIPFVLAGIAGLAMRPTTDPDLFWHLATGRWIVDNRRIPMTDPFSWTVPGREWIAHEWLTEVVFEAVHRVGGFGLLVAISIAVIVATFAVVARSARALGAADGVSGTLLLVGAFGSAHTWGPRPQVITLLLFAWFVARLRTWSRALVPTTPWLFVPVTVVWSNMHGGFVFGLTAVWAFALAVSVEAVAARVLPSRLALTVRGWRPVRTAAELGRLWLVALGCVLASMATPNTWKGLVYPFTYLGDNASTRYVGEWVKPWLAFRWMPFFAIAAVTVVAAVRRWQRLGLLEAGLLLFFGFLAFDSVRNIPSFVVVALPLVASLLARTPAERLASETRLAAALEGREMRRVAAGKPPRAARSSRAGKPETPDTRVAAWLRRFRPEALVIVVALGVVNATAFTHAGTIEANRALQPIDALRAYEKDPGTGHLLNHYNFGGYLIWEGIKVFTDGRPDMYGDAFVDDYWLLNSATGDWRGQLARWDVDRVLFPKDSPLVKELRSSGWRELAADRASVLLAPPAASDASTDR